MRNAVVALIVLLGLGGPSVAEEPARVDRTVVQTRIVSRQYILELGPFHASFHVPADLTAGAVFDRLRGAIGIVAILGVAYLFSVDRRAISRRVLLWGLL